MRVSFVVFFIFFMYFIPQPMIYERVRAREMWRGQQAKKEPLSPCSEHLMSDLAANVRGAVNLSS